ncbi:ATP-binding protein [Cryptosporangium japonicum]|uniref:LuxR family transcriptional regulator n=1 Tax=Cryptosporangium japonicum TaxID=80872 RepID=A0ABP3DXC1_9ACTN
MTEPSSRLIGRTDETAAVRELLTGVSDQGAVLLVDGEPGVGKTALADAAVDQARWRGLTVLRMSGVETEADLPWATLHQLVHVLRDRVEQLPAPQRDALRIAFGEREGPPPSVFLISLATLTLLSERTTGAGLLLVVEDLHWVDRSTRTVLGFVARRIAADPVALLVTTRPGGDESLTFGDARTLHLNPLAGDDARQLLAEHAPELAEPLRNRVLDHALGNPLALIELGAAARRGDFEPDVGAPLSRRLEDAFARRLHALGDVERALVLVAAVSADARQSELVAAAGRLSGRAVDAPAVAALVEYGLLRRESGNLRFRHPLVRSAVLQSAGVQERASAHRAVAAILPPGTDRQIWHLAVTAAEPDEELAQHLENGGGRSRQSGDPRTAMAAYARAAELSPGAHDQARRTCLAAEAALEAGRVAESRALVEQVTRRTADRSLLARVAWLQELLPGGALQRGEPATAITIADEMFAAGHADQAINVLVTMAFHYWGSTPEGPAWSRMIERVTTYGAAPDDPRLLWLMAFGTPGANSAIVRARIDAMTPGEAEPEGARLLALAYDHAGAFARVRDFTRAAEDDLRRTGQLAALAMFLQTVASQHFHAGDGRRAIETVDESQRLAEEVGEPFLAMSVQAQNLLIRAHFGEDVRSATVGERYPDTAFALDYNPFQAIGAIVDGVAEAKRGRFERAFEHLRRVLDPDSPIRHWSWGDREAFPHFVDVAVRIGRHDEAAAAIDRIAGRTGLAESPVYASMLVFARAAVAGTDEAFEQAISPEHNVLPYWRARAGLLHGEQLRRRRTVSEARRHLRTARDAFDRIGATGWADTARAELRAAGEESPGTAPRPGSALTPQEERIATLAADGLTNREIAERLFLSPRTVGAHLYAVYRKLEINSRTELGAALGALRRH